MRGYLPHYMSCPASRFHRELADDLHEIQCIRGQKRNYIGPRGSAKSSWLKGYALHGAIEGIEPLTLLLADTSEQAKKYLDSVKEEVELNPAIARDYPGVAGKGRVWQSDRIRLRNGCEIVARGAGGRILGMARRNRRPTLVIVDDGNQRGDAYSETTRTRKLDWFTKDVLPAGEPSTNFVVAGTPIHSEAIVCELQRRGWQTRAYSAIDRFPDNLDLWHEWERIALNLVDLQREEHGQAFYEQNREAMEAGAVLLWPEWRPLSLYELMKYRAQNGEGAFRTEYSADPGAPEGAEWPAEFFGPELWFDEWPESDLALKIITLDPSKGESLRSDYQAHAKIGLGGAGTKHAGTVFVECDLRKEHVEAMVARTYRIYREWTAVGRNVDRVLIEDNATMGLLRLAIQTVIGADLMPWEPLTNTEEKNIRIAIAGPYLSQKRIRVRNTAGGRELVKQWQEWPFARHDDGPDAVATGIRWLQKALSTR